MCIWLGNEIFGALIIFALQMVSFTLLAPLLPSSVFDPIPSDNTRIFETLLLDSDVGRYVII
jgi:hypothetical protein